MPEPEFDALEYGLSNEDKEYINGHRDAFKRQAAAHAATGADEERKKAAEEHMRATQMAAGVPVTLPPSGVPAHVAPRPTPVGVISLMVAVSDPNGGLPATTEKFAPDWLAMKEIIAKYNGTWTVTRHEFSTQVSDILGFFVKDGWPKPADSTKETFEAIVKNGRVFRTDPE